MGGAIKPCQCRCLPTGWRKGAGGAGCECDLTHTGGLPVYLRAHCGHPEKESAGIRHPSPRKRRSKRRDRGRRQALAQRTIHGDSLKTEQW